MMSSRDAGDAPMRCRFNNRGRKLWVAMLGALCLLLLLSIGAAPASAAAESAEPLGLLSPAAMNEALAAGQSDLGSPLTDPEAAQELPHQDLNRGQVIDLLEGVFGGALQSPAGEFDNLDVRDFLSNNAAVVLPSSPADSGGNQEGAENPTPVLLESTIPILLEGEDGLPQELDLTLEADGNQIESTAPLVPVAIPQQLGEGIELSGADVKINLEGSPNERAPSIIEESVAAYPNVDTDTDFAVAPTPTGVETLTTLRSPDSPRSQAFTLDLPAGALLEATDHGAQVAKDGEAVLTIKAPTAIDANGDSIPAKLAVSDSSITVTVSPGPNTAWPVLVDPLYESFDWQAHATTNTAGWTELNNTTTPHMMATYYSGLLWGAQHAGLFLGAPDGTYPYGAQADWVHGVPHLFEMSAEGKYPASYITTFNAWGVGLETNSADAPGGPFFAAGIYDPATQTWATGKDGKQALWTWPGNGQRFENASLSFTSGSPGQYDHHAQLAYGLAFAVSQPGHISGNHQALLGAASIQVADEERPTVSSIVSPQKWVNTQATEPITFKATDLGLGVKYTIFNGLPSQVVSSLPCTGVSWDSCPTSTTATLATNQYNPASMPQGYNNITLSAGDPLGNEVNPPAFGKAQVKVDHTKPAVALSGSITEQAKLGATLPQYTLSYTATDGSAGAPQSGVTSTEVKVDGKAVELKYAPGCATENCSISKTWTLNAAQYGTGTHTIQVTATDGVNLSTTTPPLEFTLSKDTVEPLLNAPGTLYSAPQGWVEQKAYSVTASAEDPKGYGTISFYLKIDGAVIKGATGSCPSGGCSKSLSSTVNMAAFKGGEHSAELIATDGAGNVAKKTWTINVDPSGTVPDSEAAATLEAAEDTQDQLAVVLPTDEALSAVERAEGNDPWLEKEDGEIVSGGIPVETTISNEGGLEIEGTQGTIEVVPVTSSPEAPSVVNDVAAVESDSALGADSIVRPKYNGALQFQSIREADAPETYSWEVDLSTEQTLAVLEGGISAAVYYKDGTQAMLIEAMPAVDAVGHAIPTHLSVSGNIVTLMIEHKSAGVVYPVVAGPSFEVGYVTVEAYIPPPPPPPAPPAEPEGSIMVIHEPPRTVYVPDPDAQGASASSLKPAHISENKMRKCQTYVCAVGFWEAWLEEAYLYNGKPHVTGGQAWHDTQYSYHHCNNYSSTVPYSIDLNECTWIGNHAHYYRENAHYMCAQLIFHVSEQLQYNYHAETFHNFGDGYAGPHQNSQCTVFNN